MITVDITKVRETTGVSAPGATPATGQISDSLITFFNQNAHNVVAKRTEFALETVTVTEKYDGDGTDTLMLKNYPINALTSLKIGGVEVTETYFVYNTYGKIQFQATVIDALNTNLFTKGQQNVQVTYSYYDSDDLSVVQTLLFYMVCIDTWVASGANKSEGIRRMDFKDYEISYDGQPYGAQIKLYQAKVEEILDDIGGKATFGVI